MDDRWDRLHGDSAVKHVSLNGQVESVQRFVLSLAAESDESVLELNGQPVVRMLPVGVDRNGDSVAAGDKWTDVKNARRCQLIDKEIDDELTPEERSELEDLQDQMLRYRHRVAPLPLEYARHLLEELEKKAAQALNPTR